MNVTLLGFGIVKEMFQASSKEIQLKEGATVALLKEEVEKAFPGMKTLQCYMVAVNDEYAEDTRVLYQEDEIAIIPPVSGG